MTRFWRIFLLLLLTTPMARGADAKAILIHDIKSPFEAGSTRIRVLLPDKMESGKKYPVVYILPVEAKDETRYGDGMLEALKQNLANDCQAIFVEPTFSDLPWYADHPTNPDIRQESYFLKVVIPFIEQRYPAQPNAAGRLLLGFSKSGWGAFSLILRHPDLFGKAAAWDAPLMMDQPGPYGSGPIFGTRENFEAYHVVRLLEQQADHFQSGNRLSLMGYGNFRDEMQKAHALMVKLNIKHEYRDGPARKHEWGSGWLPEAAKWLVNASAEESPTPPHPPATPPPSSPAPATRPPAPASK